MSSGPTKESHFGRHLTTPNALPRRRIMDFTRLNLAQGLNHELLAPRVRLKHPIHLTLPMLEALYKQLKNVEISPNYQSLAALRK